MNKSSIIALSIGVPALLAAGVCVYLAAASAGEADKLVKDTQSAQKKLGKYYQNDPFPSAENAETVRDNAQRLDTWRDEVLAALSRGLIPEGKNVSAGSFSTSRAALLEKLTADAPKVNGIAFALPEKFAFGFERYNDGVPADKVAVPRLMRQLKMTEMLVELVYASGATSLDGFAREVFEDALTREGASESSDEENTPRRRRPRGGSAATAARAAGPVQLSVDPLPPLAGPVPLDRQRFAMAFTTREEGFVKVVDALDALQPFANIVELSVHKVGDDVAFLDEAADARAARDAKAEETPAGAPAIRERPQPRSSRMVSGPLREAPIQVRLVVDLYSTDAKPVAASAEEEEE